MTPGICTGPTGVCAHSIAAGPPTQYPRPSHTFYRTGRAVSWLWWGLKWRSVLGSCTLTSG